MDASSVGEEPRRLAGIATDSKTATELINCQHRRLIGRVNTFEGTSVSLHLNHSKRNQFSLSTSGLGSHPTKQPSRRSGAALFPFSRIKRMQISLVQLDTAARTYVRWTGFHSSLLGFHTPEVNTWRCGTDAHARAGEHQRDKHGDSHEMRRTVGLSRRNRTLLLDFGVAPTSVSAEGFIL